MKLLLYNLWYNHNCRAWTGFVRNKPSATSSLETATAQLIYVLKASLRNTLFKVIVILVFLKIIVFK